MDEKRDGMDCGALEASEPPTRHSTLAAAVPRPVAGSKPPQRFSAQRKLAAVQRRRLYLPQDWADDPSRRQKAGVPEDVVFKTKPMIALDQIIAACDAGLPRGVVLMDAGYGADTKLRSGVMQ